MTAEGYNKVKKNKKKKRQIDSVQIDFYFCDQ